MKKVLYEILHRMRIALIYISKGIITIIPKDRKLILFSAWNGQRYADSSMYMYEYLLEKGQYTVYWFTRNKDIYHNLKMAKYPVLLSTSLLGKWKQLRAIMLVSSVQLGDFNPYLLRKCIYYDLDHGFLVKQSGFERPECNQHFIDYTMALRKGIYYYMSASSAFSKDIICRAYRINVNNVVFCTLPRTDVFFDAKLRNGVNERIKDIIRNRTVISYLPTQRSMGKELIDCHKIFNLSELQIICEQNNAVFLVKKHFFHNKEKEDFSQYNRIIDITDFDIETQTLLFDTDILVTDYSACYIDYSVLDRPMIFYAYDLDRFLCQERDLYVPFAENNSGARVYDSKGFNTALEKILKEKNDDEHKEGRKNLRSRYFDDDCALGHAREDIANIMDCLIEGTYRNKWEASR